MNIFKIKVKTGSSKEKIECQDDILTVWIHERPLEGRANEALVAILSNYFKVSKTSIKIIKGLKSKNKTVQVG